jgi:hypothetical protein
MEPFLLYAYGILSRPLFIISILSCHNFIGIVMKETTQYSIVVMITDGYIQMDKLLNKIQSPFIITSTI